MNRLKGITRLPLLVFSLSFLLGILFASLLELKSWIWLMLAGVTLLLGWIARRLAKELDAARIYFRMVMIILAGVFLGGARYQSAQPNFTPQDVAWYNDQPEPLALDRGCSAPA